MEWTSSITNVIPSQWVLNAHWVDESYVALNKYVCKISTLQIYGKSISKCISVFFNLKNVFTYTFSLQLPFCMPYLKYLFFQFYCLLHILCRRNLLECCAMQTHVPSTQNIKTSLLLIVSFLLKSSFLFALRRSTCNDRNRFIYGMVCYTKTKRIFMWTEQVQSRTKFYMWMWHTFSCC